MIKRIYIDNYRCFTNFEFKPAQTTLILGANGSGKTSLFDVLSSIVDLVVKGADVGECFPTDTLTRWDTRSQQRFELDVHDGRGLYRYVLVLEHDRERESVWIAKETVTREGCTLFRHEDGTVHLHRNDGREGTQFHYRGARSFLSDIEERDETKSLRWFLDYMAQLWTLKLDPAAMEMTSSSEDETLARDGANFASWYRHLQQEDPEGIGDYLHKLREVFPGFRVLKLVKVSSRIRELVVSFKQGETPYEVHFDELSDGQRVLIVLYALLLGLDGGPKTLLLDEPGNYLALAEIQPWLLELGDALGDGGQLIVVSHSPEVIDHLAAESPYWFERHDGGPLRVRDGNFDRESGLKASEQVTRGILDGE